MQRDDIVAGRHRFPEEVIEEPQMNDGRFDQGVTDLVRRTGREVRLQVPDLRQQQSGFIRDVPTCVVVQLAGCWIPLRVHVLRLPRARLTFLHRGRVR